MDMFMRDPEEVGPEHSEDLNYRMNLIESVHTYEPDSNGKCTVPTRKYCYEHQTIDYHQECNLPEYSVLHYYDDTHDHGGGDCMCFEGRDY